MSAPDPAGDPRPESRPRLLVVIDPAARIVDGESVRIARDVLSAGAAGVKVCVPKDAEEAERALARRGRRRPVVVGDDRALLRAVELLHREQGLADAALSVVPVGAAGNVRLARGLGVPPDAVSAARAVLRGTEARVDLLVDDSGGVVLGGLRITGGDASGGGADGGDGRAGGAGGPASPAATLRRACRSLVRTARLPGPSLPAPPAADGGNGAGGDGTPAGGGRGRRRERRLLREERAVREGRVPGGAVRMPAQRLRVEADGELLADWDRPVREVAVSAGGGRAEVTVRPETGAPVVRRAVARAVTVAGAGFRYRAGVTDGGPVRGTRTWTVLPEALRLIVPAPQTTAGTGPAAAPSAVPGAAGASRPEGASWRPAGPAARQSTGSGR